ncbi:hypothetical protein GF325_04205 [Candidatus Bathyarchaeota archaeon]|nr:hypothetical protein [Candidatus Bathyarchaeota archaeon]
MEIQKEVKKETVWRVNLANKQLLFKAIEDSSNPEPDVTLILKDPAAGTEITVDMSKDKFLNLASIVDSFNQVCLGVEPTLTPQDYAELEPEPEKESTWEQPHEPKPEPTLEAQSRGESTTSPLGGMKKPKKVAFPPRFDAIKQEETSSEMENEDAGETLEAHDTMVDKAQEEEDENAPPEWNPW